MGNFVNPGNDDFTMSRKSKFYVDKSGLIQLTNDVLGTEDRRIVVSRPRRFGKTMALYMLEAYYSCGCDSRELFRGLTIESSPGFETHLNKHNVITLDVQGLYLAAIRTKRLNDFSGYISERVNADLALIYPNEVKGNEADLSCSLQAINAVHGAKFVFLFDEWDVVYREERFNEALKKNFSDFLRSIFKDKQVSRCIELVYMTGILPVPKAEIQSGLNNFWEYTMLKPSMFAEYIGFTEEEVSSLCERYQMPIEDMKSWYEGYQFGTVGSVYCPASVVQALGRHEVRSYWNKTGAASELTNLINSVDPSFQDTVKGLLAGTPVDVDVDDDGIDLSDLGTLDTTLAALVHLGYLTYQDGKVRIPNLEVTNEFMKILSRAKHNPAYGIMARTKELLDKTLARDADCGGKNPGGEPRHVFQCPHLQSGE